jgi:hypothetical protein
MFEDFWRFYNLKVAFQIQNTNVKYIFTLLYIFPVLNRVVKILFSEMCLQAYMKLPFEPFGIALYSSRSRHARYRALDMYSTRYTSNRLSELTTDSAVGWPERR